MKRTTVPRFLGYYFTLCFISNIVHPITPTFLQSIGSTDAMFGIAFATMAIGNFLMAPFWGTFGDRYGYVKGLSLATVGYTCGQLIFSQASGPELVLLGRFIAGGFLSGFAVSVMAYLATAAEDNQTKAKYMALFAALTSVGAALGYFIGGFLGDFTLNAWQSVRPIFYVQAIGLLLGVALIWPWVGELKTNQVSEPFRLSEINPLSSIIKSAPLIKGPLVMFLVISFLTSFATNAQDQSFNYFLRAQLKFPPSYNGVFKAIVGMIALTANLTLNIWLSRKTDLRKSIVPVLLMCSVSLVFLVVVESQVLFFISALVFYIFNAIYLPMQQGLIVRNTAGSKGEISGIFNAIKALGMCLGPLFSGLVFAQNPKLPFMAAFTAFLIAGILSVYNRGQYMKAEQIVH
jgi:DHA1 family multidrug resistance protein-like MFS transporter